MLKANPFFMIQNFRGMARSVNTSRPKHKHIVRRKLEALLEFRPSKPLVPMWKTCTKIQEIVREEESLKPHPLEELQAVKVKQSLEGASCALAYFNLNLPRERRRILSNRCQFINAEIFHHYHRIFQIALHDTKWRNMLPLFTDINSILITSKSSNVNDVLKITNDYKSLVLIGGYVDDRLWSAEGIIKFSKYPSIDVLRSELLANLSHNSQRLISTINHHPKRLYNNLKSHLSSNGIDAC